MREMKMRCVDNADRSTGLGRLLPALGLATALLAGAGCSGSVLSLSSSDEDGGDFDEGDGAFSDGASQEGGGHEETCGAEYPVDPSDAQLTGLPDEWVSGSGEVDLLVPKPVIDWMRKRLWQGGHDAWHVVRRCEGGPGGGGFPGLDGGGFPGLDGGGFPGFDGGGFPGGGGPGMTDGTKFCARPDLVAAHQECTDAEDGYQFLVMHRHMIEGLKQAFPGHSSLFDAFPRFPFDATDVPLEWRDRFGTGWAPQVIETATLLEDIENNLDQFPTEGDLGKFMQCGPMSSGATAVHGALHAKWNVNGSPALLGSSQSNVNNYMFWKLHGWIDRVWERYRVARGLTPSEPKLEQALIEQCLEMHNLGHVMEEFTREGSADAGSLPEEHGFFHETVRPIFEKSCAGCHGPSNPEGRISLGGHISSANVVANLVEVATTRGGQFRRVVAGKPDESWLYLKPAGLAANAGCVGTCNAQVMPPTGQVTLTETQLGAIRQWILDGAPGPTQ